MAIRKGVFETNSSSTHCLAVPKGVKPNLIKIDNSPKGIFTPSLGEYGWGYDELYGFYEKLNYLLTHIFSDSCPDLLPIVKTVIAEFGYTDIAQPTEREIDDSYIDHQSIYLFDDLFAEKDDVEEKIREYLADDNIVVVITNDNSASWNSELVYLENLDKVNDSYNTDESHWLCNERDDYGEW